MSTIKEEAHIATLLHKSSNLSKWPLKIMDKGVN